VRNEEALQKEAKVAKVDFVLWRTVDILATGAWEHEAVDAVNEAKFVEVDEQAEGDVHELHVTHQLGLVDRENLRDDFELNEEAVIHQQIQAEGFLEGVSLVFNGND
jgi:hypothetical protein